MTQEREETLIAQVGEINGKLDRMLEEWDYMKRTFSTHEEVKEVSRRLDKHEENHVTKKSLVASWAAVVASLVAAIIAIFVK